MQGTNNRVITVLLTTLTCATAFCFAPPAVADQDCCKSSAEDCCQKESKGKKEAKGKNMSDNNDKSTLLTVAFTQSGGFAGINKGVEIIFADLAPSAQQKLQKLVEESDILKSADIKKLNQSARDVFVYGFKVNTDKGMHQAQFDDTTMPDQYRPLMEFLRDHQPKQK